MVTAPIRQAARAMTTLCAPTAATHASLVVVKNLFHVSFSIVSMVLMVYPGRIRGIQNHNHLTIAMIIYGRRGTHLKSGRLSHVTCPQCGTTGSMTGSVFGQYAHIFWIPLFPIGKTGGTQCQHCKQVLKEKEMTPAVRAGYQGLVKETKVPIWNFAGLVIVAILITYGSYASGETAKVEEGYFKAPAKGDLYQVLVEGNYTTFRVEEVNTDSLLVSWNNYGVTKATGLYKIDKDENYSEPVSMARSEVVEMKGAKKIYHIVRANKQAAIQ